MPDKEMTEALQGAIYDNDAEQAVLGSILIDPGCLNSVAQILKPDHFYLKQHRDIYEAIIRLDAVNGGRLDPIVISNELVKSGILDAQSSKTYLYKLSENVTSSVNVTLYANIVKEQYLRRQLMEITSEINEEVLNSGEKVGDIIDSAEQKFYDLRQERNTSGPTKLSDILKSVYTDLYKLSKLKSNEYAGLGTGFADLDKMMTGLNKSDLILIGARPAMGKTSFALNMASNVASSGKKVVFFSLEMSKAQLAQRVLSTFARVPSQKFRTGKISPNEWGQIGEASVHLSNFQLYFDDTSNITVPQMKARVRQLKDVDAVFIDYLQLMKSTERTENRVTEVSEITRSLKLMAKDLNIPVVTCAQLARRTEEKGRSKKPELSDLRESGSIEQDADIVLMLYRKDYYADPADKTEEDVEEANEAELLIRKNRHGPTGEVKLAWNPEFTLFTTLERTDAPEVS